MSKNRKIILSILLVVLVGILFKGDFVFGEGINDYYGARDNLISEKIPMKIEHQIHLYNLCVDRNLDYIKTLALVQTESTFNPNAASRSNFGYMQINRVNHNRLAKNLKTANAPLDPYINLNWGTKMLEDLYRKYEGLGYEGDKLDRAVWSSYNKGEGGFKRTGEATHYINKNYKHINEIRNKLGFNK